MVLRRLLLPRVLVVTALKPVPRVNVVRHAGPGDVGPAVLRRLLLRIVDGHPAGGVVDRGVAVSPGRGTSRLQVMHPFLNSDPRLIRTRTPRLSRNRFEFYWYMYLYAYLKVLTLIYSKSDFYLFGFKKIKLRFYIQFASDL